MHTSAKEEATSQSVFQGVTVLEVIFRQVNWFLVMWKPVWGIKNQSSSLNVTFKTAKDRDYVLMTCRHVIPLSPCDITNRLQTFFLSLACPPVYIWPDQTSVMWLKPSLPATLWGQCASIFFPLPLRLKKNKKKQKKTDRAERSSRLARPQVVIIAKTGFAFGLAWLQRTRLDNPHKTTVT